MEELLFFKNMQNRNHAVKENQQSDYALGFLLNVTSFTNDMKLFEEAKEDVKSINTHMHL